MKNGVGDFIYLNSEGGKRNGNLGGHALGPYYVLDSTSRTFLIQRDELVERVNSYRVTKAPPPAGSASTPTARQTTVLYGQTPAA